MSGYAEEVNAPGGIDDGGALDRCSELREAFDDGRYRLDAAGRFVAVDDGFAALTGHAREGLLGSHVSTALDESDVATVGSTVETMLSGDLEAATLEVDLEGAEGEAVPCRMRLRPLREDGEFRGTVGVVRAIDDGRNDGADTLEFVASRLEASDGSLRVTGNDRDVSEPQTHEAELQRRQRQQRVVANLGQLALETDDMEELTEQATTKLAETLGTDYAGLLELDADAGELTLRHVVGADPGLVGQRVPADTGSQSGYTLGTDDPVVVEDLDAETRFDPPALLTDGDVSSGLSSVVGSAADPWGVLTAHATDRRSFSEEDVDFLQAVANVLATAIDRRDRERRLEEQRERLAALNSLHEVSHGITDAVVERSTREEIEQAVCEHLAASDSYRFAWIGEVDTASQAVIPRASAGTDGYLEDVEITVDPDDPRSNGPAGRAYLTGEVQTCQHVRTDPRFEPWREQAEVYGFRSSATIPIVHDDTVFGVLNVYAERPYAFADEEREIVERVGEVVGHAIAAVERKRALMSDEVLEVEFRVRDVFGDHDLPATPGRITFDRVVPVGDEEYRFYGHGSLETDDWLETLVERHPHWTQVSVWGDGDGDAARRFEIHATRSRLAGPVADHGGIVERAVVEGGDLHGTVHVPQGADVRELIDDVESGYGTVELLARRQVGRTTDSAREITLSLTEDLTDRQLTALETAYHAGFFAWPRDTSGEELAERLDISPATLSEHLRAAERKLLDALFEELPASR